MPQILIYKLDRTVTMDMFLAWFKTYRLCGLTKMGSQAKCQRAKTCRAHF